MQQAILFFPFRLKIIIILHVLYFKLRYSTHIKYTVYSKYRDSVVGQIQNFEHKMDIEALLAASNLEAAAEDSGYNTDEFEDEGTDQSDNKDEKAGLGEDKMAILKAAAAKVAVEEKRNADRVFNDTADNIREDFKAKKQSERSAEDILADASKAVNEHYNKQGAPDAEKFRTIEEEKEKEKESDEEMDEGEDDEEEGDTNEDPQLNRTLLFACFNEKVELLKSTLRKGAYYFTRDRHGWTALHWAASKGNEDLTEALLSHVKGTGRNLSRFVNAQDKISGWTPMHVSFQIFLDLHDNFFITVVNNTPLSNGRLPV